MAFASRKGWRSGRSPSRDLRQATRDLCLLPNYDGIVADCFDKAVILESIGQGVRSALFFIPGAIGVHEGGYIFVGGLLGIPGETAFALALIRRVRELALGVPGLLVWQLIEGGRAWRKHVLPTVRESEDEAAGEAQTKSP